MATLLASLFDKTELDEEKLAKLRNKDVLSEMMNEIGEALPAAKHVLIDERDIFMAEKIKTAPGKRIVAVVGAGHTEGIERVIQDDNSSRMEEINTIPPISKGWKIAGWSIPAAILLSLAAIGFRQSHPHEARLFQDFNIFPRILFTAIDFGSTRRDLFCGDLAGDVGDDGAVAGEFAGMLRQRRQRVEVDLEVYPGVARGARGGGFAGEQVEEDVGAELVQGAGFVFGF